MGNKLFSLFSKDDKSIERQLNYEKQIVISVGSLLDKKLSAWDFFAYSPDYNRQWIVQFRLDSTKLWLEVEIESYLNALSDWNFLATIKCSICKTNFEKDKTQETPTNTKFYEGKSYVFSQFLKIDESMWKQNNYIFPNNLLVFLIKFFEIDPKTCPTLNFYPGREAHFTNAMLAGRMMMLENILTDCVLQVQKNKISAHQVVLGAVSPMFMKLFEIERSKGKKEVKLDFSDFSFNVVTAMVYFAYYGSRPREDEDFEEGLKLAEELQFKHYKAFCEIKLVKKLSRQNASKYMELARNCKSRILYEAAKEIKEKKTGKSMSTLSRISANDMESRASGMTKRSVASEANIFKL
ncbi:speckle-type POZ protein A-like isoform X3 [Dinothrombium tinctorium]|uniref:Speckle-type POZ protein A-like isoform X3 n=1 Tax=Dinothrombium tinctorium TaxID=1965070 RepID=A0A3S3PZT7_9ACAR|nr:speckle-type POZ protein A-like isoform X3 [Dinothrombium tinctorium]RWS01838.1 speckle-type POZ protein A-like isoform X3 [Dinothrombium tinctorium]RWS11224.1 speckle-type POZ protein A-like isoform X3 [Dinothrombium tinctorium]